jgi:hypothetical protein
MQILVISPKRDHRAELMPNLAGVLRSIQGVKVLGEGPTNIKIEVESPSEFQKALQPDIVARCFIQPAHTFILAGEVDHRK